MIQLNDAVGQLRTQLELFGSASPLTLTEFDTMVVRSDRGGPIHRFALLGLYGESGELLSALKRRQRDIEPNANFIASTLEEAGDTLWYLANSAQRLGSSIVELFPMAFQITGDPAQTFHEIDEACRLELATGPHNYDQLLLELASCIGKFLGDFGSQRFDGNVMAAKADLIEVSKWLSLAINAAGLSLQEAAERNIIKVLSRWPLKRISSQLFDEEFEKNEQLPRVLSMRFTERNLGSRFAVSQSWNGVKVGDPITDNVRDPDQYRFHDCFHLAYAATLGWSPVLRSLLKLKRKSIPVIDEGEDGARAIIIEEAVAAIVFEYAKNRNFLDGVDRLEFPLLKSINQMTQSFEVKRCAFWEWEKAILAGFEMFRMLVRYRGGEVRIDLDRRTIDFHE